MKILSYYIDTLKDITQTNFEYVFLNKSRPKRTLANYDTFMTKGVVSDAIIIFNSKKNTDESFALAFSYINLDLKDYTVKFTYKNKNKNKIEDSVPLSLDNFKLFMKESFKIIEATPKVNEEDIFSVLKNQFLIQSLKDNVDNSLVDKIKNKRIELDIDNIQNRLDMTEILLKDNFKSRDKSLRNSPTYRKINMLANEMSKLKDLLIKEEEELTKKYQINELEKSIRDDYSLINKINKDLKSYITSETNNVVSLNIKRKM